METPIEQLDPFEILMSAMDSVIAMVFVNSLRGPTLSIFNSYKSAALVNPNAAQDILDLTRDGTKYCLLQISKKYRRKILEFLSEEGLILYISANVRQLIERELQTNISDLKSKSGV